VKKCDPGETQSDADDAADDFAQKQAEAPRQADFHNASARQLTRATYPFRAYLRDTSDQLTAPHLFADNRT
jgi:hypothetical protein